MILLIGVFTGLVLGLQSRHALVHELGPVSSRSEETARAGCGKRGESKLRSIQETYGVGMGCEWPAPLG